MRLPTIVFALTLFAGPAVADSPKWLKTVNGSTEVGALDPNSQNVAYHENDDSTTNSKALNTSRCNPAVLHFNPDEDGTNTGAEGYLWCLDAGSTTTTANNGRKILPDTDGDGIENDVTWSGATSRTSIQFRCSNVLFDPTANAGTDEYRVTIECK